MMGAIISGLIGGAIAAALTAYIARRVGKASVAGQLRFGVVMWILAAGCLVLCLVPIVMIVMGERGDLWSKAALFAGFGAAAVYCFGEAAFVRGTFDGDGISYTTPWTGSKHESWENLDAVALNDWGGWYTFTFRSGTRIRLSRYLNGHASVLELLHSKRGSQG